MTETINAVVDLSHHNAGPDFAKAAADGILGVIHKATQGTGFTDKTYRARRGPALEAGLMWGAYHFGTNAEGKAQADFFLEVVAPEETDLLVLDFEDQPSKPEQDMTLAQAEAYVSRIHEQTNRWPGLYSRTSLLAKVTADSPLANCWLWLARYGPEPKLPPAWRRWELWQYTDGSVGPEPHTVEGIGPCDRDRFNGSAAELRALWGYPAPAMV